MPCMATRSPVRAMTKPQPRRLIRATIEYGTSIVALTKWRAALLARREKPERAKFRATLRGAATYTLEPANGFPNSPSGSAGRPPTPNLAAHNRLPHYVSRSAVTGACRSTGGGSSSNDRRVNRQADTAPGGPSRYLSSVRASRAAARAIP
jgi:hypothetical protein